ncbi:ATP-binding protein [Rhabdothermincola salaria]|uniref:ATP-binding protein n=1 Tax=Rhabdothermincola salaria TaxID=2903142 RepID=UPI001E28E070|nr:ATP-binding protein [Rhabdothermincola salaria]MCD9625235.1 ATP-binding protein [Rhabdothermincola salaria]
MTLDEIRDLFLFEGLGDARLAELSSFSTVVGYTQGEELFVEGEPADHWWVVLDGRIDLYRRTGRDESVVGALDRPGLWAGGFRAWTDAAGYISTGRGGEAGRVLRVDAPSLGGAVCRWFPFAGHLIDGFFQTVRKMDAMARQRAGLIALGTLAAGLAHEINNPAAASARAARSLQHACDGINSSLFELAQHVPSARLVELDALRREIGPAVTITDSIGLADREDELLGWLERRGIDDAWTIAPAFAAAAVDVEWCERVRGVLGDDALGPGLQWVASTLATASLIDDIAESTGRVSALVDEVGSYSQLDRASTQLIDVADGLESTVTVLSHKLVDGIRIVREYADDRPRIEARPGELNQVWTNLVDNAVDAMEGRGTLRLSVRVDGEDLLVEVGDDGPGMSDDVQARAIEPFFTTKPVGKGTGLGLDISNRIVEGHHGSISIASIPGDTVVAVRLPLRAG